MIDTANPARGNPLRAALAAAAGLLLFAAARLPAQQPGGPPRPGPQPALKARSAILLDFATGAVLYEKNADTEWPPASLTKLFTLHLVYEGIRDGSIRPDDPVDIPDEAWAARMPGSSLMFLEPGQRVTVAELMKGLAVCSGNDAAVALACHVAGSVPAFVRRMNEEAVQMGLTRLRFVDPSGLDGRNRITAREFARFCLQYLQLNPQSLRELHSVPEMSYPLAHNRPPGRPSSTNTIHQVNTNGLLFLRDGVDGLKTGYIEESGYNVALTARSGGMRLVGVCLGGPGGSYREGNRLRNQDGLALLDYGFRNFVDVFPRVPELPPVRVWQSRSRALGVAPHEAPVVTVPRALLASLSQSVRLPASVQAPVAKGSRIGEIVYIAGGREVGRAPLVAAGDVPQGGPFIRLRDSVLQFAQSLLPARAAQPAVTRCQWEAAGGGG